ncbi:ADP-ribosylglycohydrolase family protein [Actinophytocola oryzae]|uniref:ADP-ribosylglycohydrolase n=1 Tax=Actinophytocola oryzae TaxID=502181 RepID=A0A4R7VF22_9PSEU|nr:ADP-ribosylglycohydrolase family protein [Actinophytocola oryzae]TDV47812.1 ADP-ribosylglycohydrolase [Actinophytocola oryzae]
MSLRLTWTQPEDLVPHALRAAHLDGIEVDDLAREWVAAGGSLVPPVTGATPTAAPAVLRAFGREILSRVDDREPPPELLAAEPDDLAAILALAGPVPSLPGVVDEDRLHGAWLGRAAGCLLGKPVEKIPREGIRAIAKDTGNWPISTYFTEIGLDPALAAQYPWNRRSRPTSLHENIDGMPEDDDLNFPLIALDLLERHGDAFTTEDVAQSWLSNLPGGRVFTAERIAYRNLLDGYEPDVAGAVGNPFRDWIGAQIRADVYGWTHPGDPVAAARLAWTDARLTHGRNGLYGAMFAAAACSAAVVGTDVAAVVEAGLSVVPPQSRFATAVRRGTGLGDSARSTEDALDAIHADYGDLHWVHVLNNAAVLAFALTRGAGHYATTITTAVTGGWDTDSTGATAGSLAGALTGAKALPAQWVDPLRNRLATSIPGFDGVGFDTLATRTAALATRAL